ncbi:ABC transporter permease [Sphingomonas morindae]|uniref:ABC transporter permease n=1 Tax=Sphingomonas morindae TaxID=1541170 RepID=A0ABY4X8L4_9SPHN|nr:ABC transporter permease [Sphingomonas morindae]USI73254.1 ABC transporter permease [Sphingomonas morindae]
MSRAWRPIWVIARRDYGATVFSRLFLLFLTGPLLPLLFGLAMAGLGGSDRDAPPPAPRVIVPAARLAPLAAARAALAARLGEAALPRLAAGERPGAPVAAWLGGTDARPVLRLSATGADDLADQMALILGTARAMHGGGGTPFPALAVIRPGRAPPPDAPADRTDLARIAQGGLFVLTLILAGMLLSNMIEERSNKVIEILAAAVPVDAIFFGKLLGMLAISLTGIAAWGALGLVAALLLAPGDVAHLATPALGWPLFLLLALCYFSTSYLLLGAVFLGIGAQASSPRAVQTLSMPVTMVQLLLFAAASARIAHPEHPIAVAAAIFPWTSPLAMLARAAQQPALWPHLLALPWQLLWLALAIRLAAAHFRRSVLKSAPPPRRSRPAH